ncbi:MAG: maltose alpha-D-glucosyltransferase [Candidatus Polarisedimenticolia bacterium]
MTRAGTEPRISTTSRKTRSSPHVPGPEPLWYKDAIIYQVHVRSFADSGTDGSGDFKGLASRLPYLRDLGVTAIWLLPFYPSPLRDDGYDIADYLAVHPDLGTLADFKHFLREAHRCGLRVITELVLNHTSDQHAWFQRARRAAPGSAWRNFYVWSDTHDRYAEARIIFKDFESSNWAWDPVARAYYWHRFYAHQPDLNWDSPDVRRAMFHVVDFWLGLGVDGLRLDAVPYLFEREGTNCENLSETHMLLRALRAHVDERFPHRMLLAEANQWPEDAAAYFGREDECHMAFHFPVMPRLFMSVRMEERYPLFDILTQTPPIEESCQWALFLRNHDELTLEMVTDEERDYMYRVYANDPRARINFGIRRRLAPLLGNDRRRIELMNGLLLSLPGTPVLYYGDEIGMGDNIYLGDRNGVRTPMQWSSDRNAGFSRASPQRLYQPLTSEPAYHYETLNVEVQQNNPSSLLWWMRRLIAARRAHTAFGRGTMEFLHPENRKVVAYLRRHEDEALLVVANLSRHAQSADLELPGMAGMVPVEMFGQTPFPPIEMSPWRVMLAPHAFYWFTLQPAPEDGAEEAGPSSLPGLQVTGSWHAVLAAGSVRKLEQVLPDYLRTQRWFAGKARRIQAARVQDTIRFDTGEEAQGYLVLVEVEYTEGEPETYLLTMAWAGPEKAASLLGNPGTDAIARLTVDTEEGLLHGALSDQGFCRSLVEAVVRRRRLKGTSGEMVAHPTRAFRTMPAPRPEPVPALVKSDQSNSSVQFGDWIMLKLIRRLDEGINPELEVGVFLTDRTSFANVPAVAGWLEYRAGTAPPRTAALLQGFVPNESDAWSFTRGFLGRYFERMAARPLDLAGLPDDGIGASPVLLSEADPPDPVRHVIGVYLEFAGLLGRRTAELHLALASCPEDPDFAPEPFTLLYQRSLYQALRSRGSQALDLLARKGPSLEEPARAASRQVIDRRERILERFEAIRQTRFEALRTRTHGDYHLGQVLYTGRDFVIIDFEGEPSLPVSARRIKRSPLRDVAAMLRSFHYAAWTTLRDIPQAGQALPGAELLERAARFWVSWVSSAYLREYLKTARTGTFLPAGREDVSTLLDVFFLEKALYEVAYELNNRPGWVEVPLQGVEESLKVSG